MQYFLQKSLDVNRLVCHTDPLLYGIFWGHIFFHDAEASHRVDGQADAAAQVLQQHFVLPIAHFMTAVSTIRMPYVRDTKCIT